MRVIHVGKFGQLNSNDDEGAITYSLRQLGHEVACINEGCGDLALSAEADFCLFHKWSGFDVIKRIKIPKVMYYFDLVSYPDPTLARRNLNRTEWMKRIIPLIQLGFCTDGTWVKEQGLDKLVWLPQGADQRVVGRGQPSPHNFDILFTGSRIKCGKQRLDFVGDMELRYGKRFHHVLDGVYGRNLADLIARARIVVAPYGPVAHCYWSNRVFTSLGFGAFLLHPCSGGLERCYEGGKEIVYYRDRDELFSLIDLFLDRAEDRKLISETGLERTLRDHTYLQRCQELVTTVKRRLGI